MVFVVVIIVIVIAMLPVRILFYSAISWIWPFQCIGMCLAFPVAAEQQQQQKRLHQIQHIYARRHERDSSPTESSELLGETYMYEAHHLSYTTSHMNIAHLVSQQYANITIMANITNELEAQAYGYTNCNMNYMCGSTRFHMHRLFVCVCMCACVCVVKSISE